MDWSVRPVLSKVKCPGIAFDSRAFSPATDINTLSLGTLKSKGADGKNAEFMTSIS